MTIIYQPFRSQVLQKEFSDKGFCVIPGVLSPFDCKQISNMLDMRPTNKRSQFFRYHSVDNSVPKSVMLSLTQHVAAFLGKPVYPSYAFAIEYHQMSEGVMEAHYDTFANPVSMTLCLEHTCNIPYQAPLFIDPAKFNNPYLSRVTISTGHVGLKGKVALNLIPGDLCIFRGREHLHWREHCHSEKFKAVLIHFFDYSINGKAPTQDYIKELPFRLFKGNKRFANYNDFRSQMSLFFY